MLRRSSHLSVGVTVDVHGDDRQGVCINPRKEEGKVSLEPQGKVLWAETLEVRHQIQERQVQNGV